MPRPTPFRTLREFFAPSEPTMTHIPVYAGAADVPQRLSSRRRKSRVTVDIFGV